MCDIDMRQKIDALEKTINDLYLQVKLLLDDLSDRKALKKRPTCKYVRDTILNHLVLEILKHEELSCLTEEELENVKKHFRELSSNYYDDSFFRGDKVYHGSYNGVLNKYYTYVDSEEHILNTIEASCYGCEKSTLEKHQKNFNLFLNILKRLKGVVEFKIEELIPWAFKEYGFIVFDDDRGYLRKSISYRLELESDPESD